MSFPIQKSDAFGFHTNQQFLNKFLAFDDKPTKKFVEDIPKMNKGKNAVTVAGYLPIIGTIVAIAKLVFIRMVLNRINEIPTETPRDKEHTESIRDYLMGQTIRSCIELTSLGFLLLIPDIIFTIERNRQQAAAVQ